MRGPFEFGATKAPTELFYWMLASNVLTHSQRASVDAQLANDKTLAG